MIQDEDQPVAKGWALLPIGGGRPKANQNDLYSDLLDACHIGRHLIPIAFKNIWFNVLLPAYVKAYF